MLIELPNGQVADVPDDAPPQVIAKIKAQNAPTPKSRAEAKAAGLPRKSVDRNLEARRKMETVDTGIGFVDSTLNTFNDLTRGSQKGATFNFGDEVAGVAKGVGSLLSGDGFSKGYQEGRDTERTLNADAANNSPIASTIGEVTGALAMPMGAGKLTAKALQGAGKAVGSRALRRAAVQAARGGAVSKGIVAGAEQGALNAAGAADELGDIPGAALHGGLVGGTLGGVLGGGGHILQKGVDAFKRGRPENAATNAFERLDGMLKAGKTDAATVRKEIQATDLAGGDARVGEMTPGLRSFESALSRKPGLPASNDLIERAENRIADRPSKVVEQVRGITGIKDDALELGDSITAARKGAGGRDYAKGGSMDTPLNQTDEVADFFGRDMPKQTADALRAGYDDMLLRRESPGSIGLPDEAGTINAIPNLRALDYAKRGFDSKIKAALKAGDNATAQGLSQELSRLKGIIADNNPEYAKILATQRDAFQKINALEIGQNVLARIAKDPRTVLREIKAMPRSTAKEARIGIIDAFAQMDNKADPVAMFRNAMRNPAQRRIFQFAFGGKGNLGRFERFLSREVRATRADVMSASGRQSITSGAMMADEALEGGSQAGNVVWNAFKGLGYGGPLGAIAGASRAVQNIATGTNKATQEEIARILLSKGDDLEAGISKAQDIASRRTKRNVGRSVMRAKAGQQLFTSQITE